MIRLYSSEREVWHENYHRWQHVYTPKRGKILPMQLIATVKAIVPSPPFFLVVPLAISADGHDKADEAGQSLSQRTTERFLVGELPMGSTNKFTHSVW